VKDEGVSFMADKGLPEVVIPFKGAMLPVLPQLFAVCGGGGKAAWGWEGQYPCHLADIALQSLEPRGDRLCTGRLEGRIPALEKHDKEKGWQTP